MASYNSILLTDNGVELLNRIVSNGTKLTFTKAQATQTQYTPEQIKNLTSLAPIAQDTQSLTVSSANSTQTKVSIIFDNTALKSDYIANSIGLYASDGTDETLFAVATAKIAEQIPAYDGTQAQSMVIDFYLALNAKNATVNIENAGMVSGSQLSDAKADLTAKINVVDKNAIHLAGNETIIGAKNFTGNLQKNGVDVATKNDNVASADKLTTARKIGGISFDGTADIILPGVNATGNQNTTGLANAVQSLEITNGTDLSTVKGYGGSAVYHIASGITLTSTPSDYSGKGAILKVTESGSTVYQELIDVVTDNGAWIRIIDGSTVNDWQTKGGGGVKVLSEADIPTPTYASSSYPTDRSKYTPTFSKMHIYATNNTLRLTGNLSVTGTYYNSIGNKMGYLIDTSPLLTSNTPQVALNGVLWGRRNMISTTTLVTTEVSQSLSGKMWIDYISFNGKYFYYHVQATDSIYSGTWYSGNIPIDITVTYS